MPFPIIPFATGVAVGSLVTCGYKDKALRERVVKSAQGIYSFLGTAATRVLDTLSGRSRATTSAGEDVEEKVLTIREEAGTDASPAVAPRGIDCSPDAAGS